jgi:hypothetical protein
VTRTLDVAWPFVVAWLALALPLGVYRGLDPRRAALAWLWAWPLALALRHMDGRGDAVGFAVVLLLLPMAVLTGWRTAARVMTR